MIGKETSARPGELEKKSKQDSSNDMPYLRNEFRKIMLTKI